MYNDFIKISPKNSQGDYWIEIYFSKINSTIRVEIKESEFLQLILDSAKLYNDKTKSVKLHFSDRDLSELISAKKLEELKNIKVEEAAKQTEELFFRLQSEGMFEEEQKSYKPVVDVEIYIPDEIVNITNAERITNSCGEFMESLGFELETEDEPVIGSFFKKIRFIFNSTIGEEDLVKLYEKGKKALELKYVELPTAEQTEKLANSAEKLVSALDNVEEGVIRCGALIVLKKQIDGKPRLIVQQLSTEMIVILDKHPRLIFNVNTVYELLTGDVRSNDVEDPDSDTALIVNS